MGLVAQQAIAPVGVKSGHGLRRHMSNPRRHTGRRAQQPRDLIPCQPFVAGDVKRLTNGAGVPQEADECAGKVAVMGQRPQ